MCIRSIVCIIFLAAAVSSCDSGSNQTDKSGMKALAADNSFKDAHKPPKPIHSPDLKGSMVSYPVSDGRSANAYLSKARVSSNNFLLMFHEWWGLNDNIRREADRYAADLGNVNVLALDLYDGKVATTADSAQWLMQQADDHHIEDIINGAIRYIGPQAQMACIGWCYGGGWSLQAGILHPAHNIGIVMYYGMPEKDEDQIRKIQSPVIGFFGTKDKFITPQLVKNFAGEMAKLHKSFRYKEYDAVHAFANPSNPDYDQKATADARAITLSFLKKQFGR